MTDTLPPIERAGQYAREEWAIRMAAGNLRDQLIETGFIRLGRVPQFRAIMDAIERYPDVFRRRAYSIDGMSIYTEQRDRRGRPVKCWAVYGRPVPTDTQIERQIERQSIRTGAPEMTVGKDRLTARKDGQLLEEQRHD